MKICIDCCVFYPEDIMACRRCKHSLSEITLSKALEITKPKALKSLISGTGGREFSNTYKQYQIRSFLQNHSLFLDYDLNKYRLKHGPRLKRFLITPPSFTGFLNIPWFLYNIFASNLFHLNYTEYCPKCNCKYVKGEHSLADCEYNIEYFNILDDILSGEFHKRRRMYQQFADESRVKGHKSAYNDLFHRNKFKEIFWDFVSVSGSIVFWYAVIVGGSQTFIQQLAAVQNSLKHFEWLLPDGGWMLPDQK